MRRIFATGLLAVVGVLAMESTASAQEIQLTGPLAGAPAVRQLRWYRNKRFEIAPTFSFTLLDEYKRNFLVGARLQYHFTDWLGLGVWGAYNVVKWDTALTDSIEEINVRRWADERDGDPLNTVDRNASLFSVGYQFPNQLGVIQWMAAPQITGVPFRGKLAIFEKLFVDIDMFFFVGPAFIGLKERADYTVADLSDQEKTVLGPNGKPIRSYPMASRVAITATFGGGFNFYPLDVFGFGVEYRATPFSWNYSGFDSRGGPPNDKGGDMKIDSDDRLFRMNQMISVTLNFMLPAKAKISN